MRAEYGWGRAMPGPFRVERRAEPRPGQLSGRVRLGRFWTSLPAIHALQHGVVSTASLLVGVAAAGVGRDDLLLVGLACLAAGALAMTACELASSGAKGAPENLSRALSALAAGGAFAAGGGVPLLVTALAPTAQPVAWLAGLSLLFLAALGATATRADRRKAALDAFTWGAVAVAASAAIGSFLGPLV
jgi:VIT1/CCC1 family predicted Fe2+/Mn2+ transporter